MCVGGGIVTADTRGQNSLLVGPVIRNNPAHSRHGRLGGGSRCSAYPFERSSVVYRGSNPRNSNSGFESPEFQRPGFESPDWSKIYRVTDD